MRQHYLIYRNRLLAVTFFFLLKQKMILLITSSTLHKHYNLILALQLYINRSNTALNPEKKKNQMDIYPRQQKYANNNNRQREKQGGGG